MVEYEQKEMNKADDEPDELQDILDILEEGDNEGIISFDENQDSEMSDSDTEVSSEGKSVLSTDEMEAVLALQDSNANLNNETIYTAKCDSDFWVCFKNEFVSAKQTPGLREAKLLRVVISQVLSDAKDFKSYKVRIKDLAKLMNIKPSSLYRDVKELCENLHKRIISIERPDGTWETFNWVQLSFYDGEYIHIMLSDQLKPYLLDLQYNFTRVQMREIAEFSSLYGLRIYEMIKSEWTRRKKKPRKFTFSIARLRIVLDIGSKLTYWSHFKTRVIVAAVDSINSNPAAWFSIVDTSYTKTGKEITEVTFTIDPKGPSLLTTD